MTNLLMDVLAELERELAQPPAAPVEVTDHQRVAALRTFLALARSGNEEAQAKLDALRTINPALHGMLTSRPAEPVLSAPRAAEPARAPERPPRPKRAPRPSPAPLEPVEEVPFGSDGRPLFAAPPPPDARIGELRTLFAQSSRLRRRGYPSGWGQILLMHGDTLRAWQLIGSAMQPDESAADFIARCYAGAQAARAAERSVRMPRRNSRGEWVRP